MDQSEQRKLNKLLRRSVKLVVPVSLFGVFVWYSSGFSILPQSFNAYLSTCLFSMLAHSLERKYMFLICNAILAFLAKSSLLSSSSSSSSSPPPISPNFDNQESQTNKVAPAPLLVELQVEQKQEFYEQQQVSDEEEERGRENEAAEEGEEDVERRDEEVAATGIGNEELLAYTDTDTGTAMATNDELASTEELNRKVEEFIRKMKEEIRIEAHQIQPIAESLVHA